MNIHRFARTRWIHIALIALIAASSGASSALAGPDDSEGSEIRIVTVNAEGERIAGACFMTTEVTAKVCDADDGNNDGVNMLFEYRRVDIFGLSAPAPYLRAAPFSVKPIQGGVKTVRVTLQRGGSTLIVRALDSSTNALAKPGACFRILLAVGYGNLFCDHYDGVEDGVARISGLAPGTYTYLNESAPVGYWTSNERRSVTISQPGSTKTTSWSFTKAPDTSTVRVTVTNRYGKLVPGSHVAVNSYQGLHGEAFDGDDGANDGRITIKGIRPGMYYIFIMPPEGYTCGTCSLLVTKKRGEILQVTLILRRSQ